ncbi:ComEC/Rec2 family competence protein [Roseovarius phycicola]|uniref:ComEC/Rec2 family competence protein n=1 Tax=Roseovarius phycicola TaxID=3080976 RepID=A0ABZ2HCH2_9RHOB
MSHAHAFAVRLRQTITLVWLSQRGYQFGWVPVCLAMGIGGYFLLKFEPGVTHYVVLGMGAGGFLVVGRWLAPEVRPALWALSLVALGGVLAGVRAHMLAEPVLGWRYYGPVQGRLVALDRSASDALRLTLDQVVLTGIPMDEIPARVRVALHGDPPIVPLTPGTTLIMTAHLSPPGGPVEPGGFDFQRHAWFQQLGAVGYTRTPVLRLRPPGQGQWITRMRMALSARVQSKLEGEAGAFAAAIMTGDRSAMGQETLTALRVSNLAHLLAISGLHMGLLTGFVFGALRLGFAAIPSLNVRWPTRKLAAIGAFFAAAGYFALSGGNVSTERAFVMVTVMLIAVLADRRVLSLRSVAVAAIIVLVLRPEALLGPGFQMSFAATTALIAVFNGLRGRDISLGPRWLRPAVAVMISSAVAGLATAPIAAAHFNQIAHYGLIANLLSVPLMGVIVIPMAVLAGLLMPLGLEGPALGIMGLALDWILSVAHTTSGWEGARGMVPSPGKAVLPLIALGALFALLWKGRLRMLGVVPVVLGFTLWAGTPRPDVLIAETGGLVGIMTDQGRALSKPRGAGFVALNWLENDGNPSSQDAANALWTEDITRAWNITHLRGKKAAESFDSCRREDWVILSTVPRDLNLPCQVIHPKTLRASGALALYRTSTGIKVVSARDVTGTRLWHVQ